jgi:hypothetical protein
MQNREQWQWRHIPETGANASIGNWGHTSTQERANVKNEKNNNDVLD